MAWLHKRFERYNFIALAMTSGLLTVLSAASEPTIATSLGGTFAGLLPHIFADGCLIFIAAELVERTLLSKFNHEANVRTDGLGNLLEKKVEDVLLLSLEDAKYAAHYHIHFRPPRRSERNADVSYQEIAHAIADAEWIKILCTAGRDMFSREGTISKSLLVRTKSPIDITVLSCEPACEDRNKGTYALVRGELEEPSFPYIVSKDIGVALDDFKVLFSLAQQEKSRFRWLFYDFAPQGWFFLTDKVGYAEFYHFGLDIRQHGIRSSCIGGRVPLIKFTHEAVLYGAIKEYLSYLAGDLFVENDVAQRHRRDFFKVRGVYDSSSDSGT